MQLSRPVVLAACAAAAVLGSACGGGDGGGGGGGETVTVTNGRVTVEARDVSFDIGRIETPPGTLEVTLVQKGVQNHTFLVEDADGERVGGKLSVSNATKEDSGAYELAPGEYAYYCDVPGHRAQGMEGTLVVG